MPPIRHKLWLLACTLSIVGCATPRIQNSKTVDYQAAVADGVLVITPGPGTRCGIYRAEAGGGPIKRTAGLVGDELPASAQDKALRINLGTHRNTAWYCQRGIRRLSRLAWQQAYRTCASKAPLQSPERIACESQRVRDGLRAVKRGLHCGIRPCTTQGIAKHAFEFAMTARLFGSAWHEDPSVAPVRLVGPDLVEWLLDAVDALQLKLGGRFGLAVTLISEFGEANKVLPWLLKQLGQSGPSLEVTRGLLRFGDTSGVSALIETLGQSQPTSDPYKVAAETFCHAVGSIEPVWSLQASPKPASANVAWLNWWNRSKNVPQSQWKVSPCQHLH